MVAAHARRSLAGALGCHHYRIVRSTVLSSRLLAHVCTDHFATSSGRLFGAPLFATVLFLGLGATPKGTDMPGHFHVPALFSVVTMVGLLTLALVEVVGAWVRRRRHSA